MNDEHDGYQQIMERKVPVVEKCADCEVDEWTNEGGSYFPDFYDEALGG